MSCKPSLLSCPSEVITLITNHLQTPDLARLAQANRVLYNITIPVLWQNITYTCKASQQTRRPEISFQKSQTKSSYPADSLPKSPAPTLSSFSDTSSSFTYQDDDDSTLNTLFTSSTSAFFDGLDSLSLALIQNQVSPLAKQSIRTLEISTDYRFGPNDSVSVLCEADDDLQAATAAGKDAKGENETRRSLVDLTFVQFLKRYLLTNDAVPNLQSLRVTHENPDYDLPRSKTHTCLPTRYCGPSQCERARLEEIGAIVGNFLQYRPVRLSLDSPMLLPVQTVLESNPAAQRCLVHLHIEVLQSASEHHALHYLLSGLSNLEYLSITTQETQGSMFDHDDMDDEDDDDEDLLFQIDKALFKTAFANMSQLKTLIIKSPSLIEAFTPEAIPRQVTHLELESNYNTSSLYSHNITAQFNNLWTLLLSHDLSQLTSLSVSLWTSELFSSLPHQRVFSFHPRSRAAPPSFGNLRELTIEGDYIPAGLDALLFASNPHLQRVRIPVLYAAGAHALAQHCGDSLEDLAVYGLRNTAQHAPDFLDYRLLPLLARCHRLQSLYLHVASKTLHGFDLLHLLAPLRAQSNLEPAAKPSPSPSLRLTIEQTDFDLPHYKEVISEDEYDEFGGFCMLPLESIKQRMPLYNQIRTSFAAVDGDLSGLAECASAIDDDEATRCDPAYAPYYAELPYTKYNCIFTVDVDRFLGRNAFLFA